MWPRRYGRHLLVHTGQLQQRQTLHQMRHWKRGPLKTAVTGTVCTTSRVALTERFKDFDNSNNVGSNFQGAFAYLSWNLALSEHYVTLLHADYVNYDN